jgi:putative transposase
MRVVNKSIYLVLGVNMEGKKDLLCLWMSDNEGAKFWVSVLTELKNRGLQDILIACVNGLKGFPDTIAVEYPEKLIRQRHAKQSIQLMPWNP